MVKALIKPMKGSICWMAYYNNIAKKKQENTDCQVSQPTFLHTVKWRMLNVNPCRHKVWQHPSFSSRKLWSRQFSYWDLSSRSVGLHHIPLRCEFQPFKCQFQLRRSIPLLSHDIEPDWTLSSRPCLLRTTFELFASNSIKVVSRGRHSGVGVGWPLPGGVWRRLTDAGRENESKGGGKWNGRSSLELATLVMVVLLLVIDSSSRWCSWMYTGAAVEVSKNVCLGILLHTGLLLSAEDSPRCVTRIQAQIEFWDIQQQPGMISKMSKVRFYLTLHNVQKL